MPALPRRGDDREFFELTGAIVTDSVSSSTVTLGSGTTWTMTGNSNVTNLTNNDSSIIFTAPTGDPTQLGSYKTLTATNYTGTGGEILLNTYLGGDGSPSDRLIINGGTATGATGLMFHNTTGPGAQTIGQRHSRRERDQWRDHGARERSFSMAKHAPASSTTTYSAAASAARSPNDWFLRSTFIVPPEPIRPNQFHPSRDLCHLTRRQNRCRPVSTRSSGRSLPPMASCSRSPGSLASTTLGTLHERIGDTLTLDNAGGSSTGMGPRRLGALLRPTDR